MSGKSNGIYGLTIARCVRVCASARRIGDRVIPRKAYGDSLRGPEASGSCEV